MKTKEHEDWTTHIHNLSYQLEVCGQLHAPVTIPLRKELYKARWVPEQAWTWWWKQKRCICCKSNFNCPSCTKLPQVHSCYCSGLLREHHNSEVPLFRQQIPFYLQHNTKHTQIHPSLHKRLVPEFLVQVKFCTSHNWVYSQLHTVYGCMYIYCIQNICRSTHTHTHTHTSYLLYYKQSS
jgi:hypothetical protein